MDIIKSISYDQIEIIYNIIKLHCTCDIELDPCYSRGNFYKTGIKEPMYKFDINPSGKIKYGDCRKLPFQDNTFHTIMFDPPFLATTGKSLSIQNESNRINKRFGVYSSEKELYSMYCDSMNEFHRLLNESGILIFKCQDKVSSGKQYWYHVDIINYARSIGFELKDLFILLAKNRIVANWQIAGQKNARKYHCYFLVFQKKRSFT